MPTLHSSGVIIPGQLGPKRRHPFPFKAALTRTISFIGIPSVIQTIRDIPASAASIIASAEYAAGT